MPTWDDWDKFLNSGENKYELVKAITNYYKSKSIRERLKYPLEVTHEEKKWKSTNSQVNENLSCNLLKLTLDWYWKHQNQNVKKFYHTVMYSGLPGGSITETRVCMYQKQKIKASATYI